MPENEPNKVAQLSFRILEERKNRFVSKVKLNGLNAQDVLLAAVDAYMQDEGGVVNTANPPEPSGRVLPTFGTSDLGNKKVETDNRNPTYSGNTESAQAHALLELIHRSGHRIAIEAILANLHAFFVLVCSDARGREREIIEIPADIAAEFPDIAREYEETVVSKGDVGGAGDRTAKGHRKRPERRAG